MTQGQKIMVGLVGGFALISAVASVLFLREWSLVGLEPGSNNLRQRLRVRSETDDLTPAQVQARKEAEDLVKKLPADIRETWTPEFTKYLEEEEMSRPTLATSTR